MPSNTSTRQQKNASQTISNADDSTKKQKARAGNRKTGFVRYPDGSMSRASEEPPNVEMKRVSLMNNAFYQSLFKQPAQDSSSKVKGDGMATVASNASTATTFSAFPTRSMQNRKKSSKKTRRNDGRVHDGDGRLEGSESYRSEVPIEPDANESKDGEDSSASATYPDIQGSQQEHSPSAASRPQSRKRRAASDSVGSPAPSSINRANAHIAPDVEPHVKQEPNEDPPKLVDLTMDDVDQHHVRMKSESPSVSKPLPLPELHRGARRKSTAESQRELKRRRIDVDLTEDDNENDSVKIKAEPFVAPATPAANACSTKSAKELKRRIERTERRIEILKLQDQKADDEDELAKLLKGAD